MKIKAMIVMLLAMASVAFTGCNTISGAGKDIERGGEKVQDAAKSVQRSM